MSPTFSPTVSSKPNVTKIFIDAGANVGQSIRMFKSFYPQSKDYRIIAFEPFPENFAQLTAVYGDDPAVELVEGALSTHNGVARFFVGNPLSGTLRIDKTTGGINVEKWIEVQTYDIARLVSAHHQHRIILKLDVEGAEYELIDHMHRNNCLEVITEIFGEWHYGKLANLTESDHQKAIAQLAEHGLQLKQWEAENGYIEGLVDHRCYWKLRKRLQSCCSRLKKVFLRHLRPPPEKPIASL